MGSQLRRVNVYKCHSNGASDADFLSPGTKNVVWCWEWLPNFAYCRRELHVHEAKLYIYAQ